MLYSIMLFLHIIGTVVMFIAVGLTITAMVAMLYSKKTETLRVWASLAVKADGLLPLSVIIIFLPALYLVITTWGWHVAWINLSLAALILMTFMGPAINLRRLKNILNAADAETASTPSANLVKTVQDRLLWISVITMTALAVAIVFLMTVKLELLGSLVTFGVAILLGFITSTLLLKRPSMSN